jgi:hypothetical protein
MRRCINWRGARGLVCWDMTVQVDGERQQQQQAVAGMSALGLDEEGLFVLDADLMHELYTTRLYL